MTWVQTFSGRAFDLLNPRVEDVDFALDVPIALSRIPRFLGHTEFPYSVAQHCALGADWLASQGRHEDAAAFLLHDAHEAYMGDVTTPTAVALADASPAARVAIRNLKRRLDEAIFARAGVVFLLADPVVASKVKEIDIAMLLTERDALMTPPPLPWAPEYETSLRLGIPIEAWAPTYAEGAWRDRFDIYVRPLAARAA